MEEAAKYEVPQRPPKGHVRKYKKWQNDTGSATSLLSAYAHSVRCLVLTAAPAYAHSSIRKPCLVLTESEERFTHTECGVDMPVQHAACLGLTEQEEPRRMAQERLREEMHYPTVRPPPPNTQHNLPRIQ
eukprot:1675409-Rhodomonas_salina.3